MTKRQLNGKFINETAKKGWIVEDYLKYFEISEEAFFEALKKNFSKKAFQGIKRHLKSNEKNKKSSSKSVSTSLENSDYSETSNSRCNQVPSIKELQAQEQLLSDKLCENESYKITLFTNRQKIKDNLLKQRDNLIALTKQLEKSKIIVDNLCKDFVEINSKFDGVNAEISETKKLLENVRKEIQKQQKISLFIYDNGEIETDNKKVSLLIGSIEESQVFNTLVQNDLVESLTVKQIRQLAKVIILIKAIKTNGLKYEITFENASVEEVFGELNAN